MKILITFIVLVFAQVSLANSDCFLQSKSREEIQSLEKGGYFVGEIQASAAGELDPFILGDGGIIVLKSHEGSVAIFEENENADYTNNIFDEAAIGAKFLAVKKDCLSVVSENQKAVMERIIVNIFSLNKPNHFYVLK